jgi:Cu/Ag efflux pump CusA
MIALADLLLALGAVVHDAILDMDNIARRLRRAADDGRQDARLRTILAAALEERRPMLFATLVLLLAIAPLLLAEGRLATVLRPLAWSYLAAILASMLVALTVTPAMAALLLPNAPPAGEETGLTGRLQAAFERNTERALRSPLPAYGLAAVAVLLSFFAWTRLERDLLPGFKETDVVVDWRGPEGISLPEMTRVTTSLIGALRALPGVRNAAAHIGRAVMCNCDEAEDVNSAAVWVSIDPAADYGGTLAAIHAAVAEYPGMSGQVGAYLSKKVREAAAGDSERRLTVRAYGYDPAVLRGKAEEIRGLLAQVSGVANPRLEPQAEEPTIEVDVDLERAAAHGFKPGDVRRATASLVGGITVGAVFEQQKVFEVVVWGTPDVRRNITDVQNIALETDGGTLVRLADVAQVRLASTSNVIRRHGASRRLDVIAEVEGRPVDAVAREVADRLKAVSFPLEHHAEVLGGRAGARSALRSVEGYAVAAAVLAFLLLQAALGSWRLAAAALVGLPVVVLGSTIAVLLGGGGVVTLGSVLGGAAALALTLRVTIAMVCRFQVLEREGMPLDEALVRRGLRERFPSTAATLLATGAAVVPFVALGPAAGLELAHPMAVAMLGGLVGSMVATLVMTPALYLRFGAGTAADTLGLEPPPAAAPEPAVR